MTARNKNITLKRKRNEKFYQVTMINITTKYEEYVNLTLAFFKKKSKKKLISKKLFQAV